MRDGRSEMRGGSGGRTIGVLMTSAVILAAAVGPAAASPASWLGRVRPLSPDPSSTGNLLYAVSASSATDAWAVGYYENDTTHADDTLILHWDGTSWTQVPSPDPSSTVNDLEGVRAVSATNAWAVGDYHNDTTQAYDTLILHWNGTAWSTVGSPNPSATQNTLLGVAISSTSAKSGWAVGDFHNGKTGVEDTLTLRWNGSTWARVASPDPGKAGNNLQGVRVPSPTDAWAVGDVGSAKTSTLILHWNGRVWSRVASPDPSPANNGLYGTSGISPDKAWAVGTYRDLAIGAYRSLILHWNGTSWTRVTSPNTGSSDNILYAVRARSSTDAWAAGLYYDATAGAQRTLALHWNGKSWVRTITPNPGSNDNVLRGVTATSATNAWVVGWYVDSMDHYFTLILHWNGSAWIQV